MEARLGQLSIEERDEEVSECPWKLPPDLLALVLARVPLEARLRAAGLSRDWRAAVAAATTAISLRRARTAWTANRLDQLSRWLAARGGELESLELHVHAAGIFCSWSGVFGEDLPQLPLPLPPLARLPRLRSLVLHDLQLELLGGPATAGEAGSTPDSASAPLPALTRLELHGSTSGSSSLRSAAQLVQQCSAQLRHLHLDLVEVVGGSPLLGAASDALCAALPSCTQLTQLVLLHLQPSSSAAVPGVLRGLPQLRALTLELRHSQGPGSVLDALPLGLTRLALEPVPGLACDAGACRLSQLTALQDLQLRGIHLHVLHLEPLTGLSRLALATEYSAMADTARLLRLVAGLALRELELRRWHLDGDDVPAAAWAALTASSQLTLLDVLCDLPADALQHAFALGRPALASLVSVDLQLWGAEGVAEAARALRRLPRLKQLSLWLDYDEGTADEEAARREHVLALLQSLAAQPGAQLTALKLEDLANDDVLRRHVAGMTWLRELDVSGGGFTTSGALQLTQLRGLRSLRVRRLDELIQLDIPDTFEWHSTALDDEPSNLWQLHGEAFREGMEALARQAAADWD